jgi:hypothetical protein
MPYQTISQRPAQQRSQGQSSPGYVGYSRILDANRPGAKRMADQLAGNVQQQGQQAQQSIQQAGQQFSDKVKAGTLSYSNPLNVTRGTAAAQGQGYAQAGAMLGPQANATNREYKGPKDWAGAGINTTQLAQQASSAGDAAQGLTSMGGRAAQLREQSRGPYSAGMSTLDAALAGSGLGGRGQDLAAMYGNLSQQLIDRQAGVGKEVGAAIDTSNAAYGAFQADVDRWNQMAQPLPAPAAAPETQAQPEHPLVRNARELEEEKQRRIARMRGGG